MGSYRQRREGTRYEDQKRRNREQSALITLSRTALSTVDLDHFLDEALAAIAGALEVPREAVHLKLVTGPEDSFPAGGAGPALAVEGPETGELSVPIMAPQGSVGVLSIDHWPHRSLDHQAVFLQGAAAIIGSALVQAELQDEVARARRSGATDRLAGGIVHDFNNVVTAALGYAELAGAALPEGSREQWALEEVRDSVHRAAGLARRLLAVSRGRSPERTNLEVNALMEGAIPLLRRLVGETVQVTLQRAEQPLWIRANDDELELQVLANLAVNARHAMPTGGVLSIHVHAATLESMEAARLAVPAGPYARLTVADSGTGMDAATMARIFEAFFTTKPAGVGNGLGLATVRAIIEDSGGAIEADSQPGEGTRFIVYLPLVHSSPQSRSVLQLPTPVSQLPTRSPRDLAQAGVVAG